MTSSHVFDWDYPPTRGAFTVNVMSHTTTERLHLSTVPLLGEAVCVFARHALPVRFNVGAAITDDNDVVLLRYMCFDEPLAAGWWGCREAFRHLDYQGIGSSVDRAIWEERAKYAMGVPT
jgi:hypothetical protein